MFDAKKVKNDIVNWIAGYFKNNGSPETKAVIGISGGKDSSIVAALCKDALGKERVLGVLMPQGSQHDIGVSYEVCKALDIPYIEINIKDAARALYGEIEKTGLELNNVASFNTPARIRMTTLYAISGIVGGRVANTSNLSEDWVGYATKFGDSAGDFSPLSNLTVTEVKAVGRESGLTPKFIDKTPIDGLCGKTDEDNLGFTYAVLDKYIREGVCEDEKVKEKIDKLHKANLHKLNPMPAFGYNSMIIRFYSNKDEYGCFSNFSANGFEMDGKYWPTSEHYFQAQKFADEKIQEKIRQAKSPKEAASIGRDKALPLKDEWEKIKDDVMRKALQAKFTQNQDIKAVLLSTSPKVLIENAPNDYYWGCGNDGTGFNRLGVLLMELRERFLKQK